MSPRNQTIIGTSGHIDHGKTTLIQRITGINTDRWEEEQRRGITIDIGFAHLQHDDVTLSFIDVPGHKDFVTNMLAGIHSVDFGILVIAADESVMPQTREHLAILTLLGIRPIIPVMTKIDLADNDLRELTELEIRELFAEMGLAEPDIVPAVSGTTGEGVGDLLETLCGIARDVRNFEDRRPPYLHVDRSFTMRGHGTVITGTLMSGDLKTGDRITLFPSGRTSPIKKINNHGEEAKQVAARKRVALNLPQVDREQAERGMIATTTPLDLTSRFADAAIRFPFENQPIDDLTRVRISIGSEDVVARIKLVASNQLETPGNALCQLRFEREIACFNQQPFIIRSYSPVRTIGGGTILDSRPRKRRGYGGDLAILQRKTETDDAACLLAILDEERSVDLADLQGRLFLSDPVFQQLVSQLVKSGQAILLERQKQLLHPDDAQQSEDRVLEAIAAFHAAHPRKDGMPASGLKSIPDPVLKAMESDGRIIRDGTIVRLPDFQASYTSEEETAFQQLVDRLRQEDRTPTLLTALERELANPALLKDFIERGVAEGLLIRISTDVYMHATCWESFLKEFRSFAAEKDQFEIQDIKGRFPLSRKYLIPIMEYLDGAGITVKSGNVRKLIQ